MAAIDADDIQVPVTNSLKVEFFLMSILNEKSVLIKYAFFYPYTLSNWPVDTSLPGRNDRLL